MKKQIYQSSEVMFLSGDINYTEIYLIGGKKMISSSTLLRHQERLDDFIRVSKKYLVNPKYIAGYELHGKSMHLEMKNGNQLLVSRRKMKDVLLSITALA